MVLNNINYFMQNPAKLKWACRRGMLELDVLLGNFLEKVYPNLTEEDKLLFIRLLDQPDPELFDWLISGDEPEDGGLNKIVKLITYYSR